MRMSLLTNSLAGVGINDLHTIADWAYANNIKELDVGPSIKMDRDVFESIQNSGKVSIKTMIYCRNFLSSNVEEAEMHQKTLIEKIKFAGEVGIEKVVCSTGVAQESYEGVCFDPMRSFDKVVDLTNRFLEEAEKANVKLCWENCPVMGNIAVSPDVWAALFDKINNPRLGLCYDPSHLVWQFIDPYKYIFEFKDKIFHFHAKDTHVDQELLQRYGVQQHLKWWKHRLPGLGDIDWNRIVDNLYQIGYDGAIAIEHEDPIWDGSEEKVKLGILKTRDHVSQYFIK